MHLAFEHLRNRNARPFRHHLGDVLFVNFFLQRHAVLLNLRELLLLCLQFLFEFGNRSVLNLGRPREVARISRLVQLQLQLFHLCFGSANVFNDFLL